MSVWALHLFINKSFAIYCVMSLLLLFSAVVALCSAMMVLYSEVV